MTQREKDALHALRLEIEGAASELARAEGELDEAFRSAAPNTRALDLYVIELRTRLDKLRKRLNAQVERRQVSPALARAAGTEAALNDRPPAKRRFWKFGRKDMQ